VSGDRETISPPRRDDWHRRYVGGLWDEIGRLQFDFLTAQGLKPQHRLLDLACGSLRAGVHLVPYLEPEHYLGIDHNAELIQAGIDRELGPTLYRERRPQFVVSGSFEFERFGVRPDFAIAQSLFTHLPPEFIEHCLEKLRDVMADEGVFYATFNECSTEQANPAEPHDHRVFLYTREQMQAFAERTGWRMHYIGKWGHPRGQRMLRLQPQ